MDTSSQHGPGGTIAAVAYFRSKLEVIGSVFGRSWVVKSKKSGKVPTQHYFRGMCHNATDILSKAEARGCFNPGDLEGLVDITEMADLLRATSALEGFPDVLRRFKNDRRNFDATMFEGRIARLHLKLGQKVRFIPRQKDRTPDLEISDGHHTAGVECKDRDETGTQQLSKQKCPAVEDALFRLVSDIGGNYDFLLFSQGHPSEQEVSLAISSMRDAALRARSTITYRN